MDLTAFDLEESPVEQAVVICTDARTESGSQIRTLILTMLYRPDPYADSGGVCLHCGDPPVRDYLQGQDLVCL
ncbi:MAG: hypothetical protein ACLU9S_12950 [Oscillospiraceae bacterium]